MFTPKNLPLSSFVKRERPGCFLFLSKNRLIAGSMIREDPRVPWGKKPKCFQSFVKEGHRAA